MAGWTVELRGPADPAFVRLVRTATLSVASQVGFAIDPCDELRMAADEACNAVIGGGASDLLVVFEHDAPMLTVTVGPQSDRPVALDATAELVLATMVDHFALLDSGSIVLQKALVS